jgi:phage terminase large subunit-like protein
VSLDEIETTIVAAHERYRLARLAVDPWNAAQLVERCKKRGVPIEERHQQGKNLVDQCMALIEVFRSGSIKLYPYEPLLQDLRRVRVEERSYGIRLVAPYTADGTHGDTVTALSIALGAARDIQSFNTPVVLDGLGLNSTGQGKGYGSFTPHRMYGGMGFGDLQVPRPPTPDYRSFPGYSR